MASPWHSELKPASYETLQNWWTVILIVQFESCSKYSKQFEGIKHRIFSFPSKIHMGHFPINYRIFAVDDFFYINVCHLKKISMIFKSHFKSNFIQLCSWWVEERCSRRMVWWQDRWRRWLQGWCNWGTVKDGRWRIDGVGRMAQWHHGWHGCGRMALKMVQHEDDTCQHRLTMKGRKNWWWVGVEGERKGVIWGE